MPPNAVLHPFRRMETARKRHPDRNPPTVIASQGACSNGFPAAESVSPISADS